MASTPDARVRVTFGVLCALVAAIWLIGVFGLVRPRFWLLDVPAALLAIANASSAVGLLARRSWGLRALSLTAWVSFVGGLLIVSLVVLTMVFLRGIHGEDGVAAVGLAALIVALLVPYTLALPALQLLWLKREQARVESHQVAQLEP
jgi:hypothetical protein